jgi:phytoene/squalene synthetase
MATTNPPESIPALAASITKKGSIQTYYTIRLLADRVRMADACRAYAYFRWVDDTLDAPDSFPTERAEFLARQRLLLNNCYKGNSPVATLPEEDLLVTLVSHDPDCGSGLHSYLSNMMKVMAFDVERRGRFISAFELNEYTRDLASAVMECIHYFVGHDCPSPHDETRYQAVSAAHITHMLRDTYDDVCCGYYNIPREVLEANRLSPEDVHARPYREWVRERVELARRSFSAGRLYLARVKNTRCRLACLAYITRFEGVLDSIEREEYLLRASYPERKNFSAMARAAASIGFGFISRHRDYLAATQTSSNERSLRDL